MTRVHQATACSQLTESQAQATSISSCFATLRSTAAFSCQHTRRTAGSDVTDGAGTSPLRTSAQLEHIRVLLEWHSTSTATGLHGNKPMSVGLG